MTTRYPATFLATSALTELVDAEADLIEMQPETLDGLVRRARVLDRIGRAKYLVNLTLERIGESEPKPDE